MQNSAYGSMIRNLQAYTSLQYTDDRFKAANIVNKTTFRDLEEIDKDFFEINLGKDRIKLNLATYIGHHILCLAKRTMLSFYYDFCMIFFKSEHMALAQMDTDSLYFFHTFKSLDELVRPEMKQEYEKLVYGSCFQKKIYDGHEEKWVPDLNLEVKPALDKIDVNDVSLRETTVFGNYYLPRKCCLEHEKIVDSRTCGQFKLEMEISASDGVMHCLNSKSYVAHSEETNFTKLSSKGLSKRFISNPVEIFESVLKDEKPRGGENRGFLFKQNQMRSYNMFRQAFSFLYLKRLCLRDSFETKCLPITLKPYKRSDEVEELSFKKKNIN